MVIANRGLILLWNEVVPACLNPCIHLERVRKAIKDCN